MTAPTPALNDLSQSKPSIFSNNTAPKKQPKIDPKGIGMNNPTNIPINAPVIPILVPPNFFTPKDGKMKSNIVIAIKAPIIKVPVSVKPSPTKHAISIPPTHTNGGPSRPGIIHPANPNKNSIIDNM